MVSAELDDSTARSESEHTSYDSDQVEEFDSEEEFSRVMPTPRSNRREPRAQLQNSSTPRSQRASQRNRQATDAPDHVQQTQNTQQLPLLSGTQLREMMGEDESDGEEEDREDQEDDETKPNISRGDDETGIDQTDLIGVDKDHSVAGDETDEPIDTDGIGPDIEDERILSSNDEADGERSDIGEGDADVTPVGGHNTGPLDSQGMKINGFHHLGEGAYIEETPMKLLSMPTPPSSYVNVIVKWENDPNWWPARAEKSDWEGRKKQALVMFRLNQSGTVDLANAAGEYELKQGDKVHVYGSGRRGTAEYIIKELKNLPGSGKVITTIDGYDRAVLETRVNAKSIKSRSRQVTRTIEVDVCDIYFTNKNIESWRDNHEAVASSTFSLKPPTTPRHNKSRTNPLNLVDPIDISASTSTPKKRRQPAEGSPKRRSTRVGSFSDVLNEHETSPKNTPRNSPSRSIKTGIRGSPARMSPTRSRALASSPAASFASVIGAATTSGPGVSDLFSTAVFSVSISSATREKLPGMLQLPELIKKHGGEVLEEGLSQKVKLSEIADEDGSMPDLEHDFGNATFAAVISDMPRRTLKYLEMLALGWPCLHYQYLLDCVERNEMLDWRPYLLPAGELNLEKRKMAVSMDASVFHRRWLHKTPLNEQFRKRKISLRCSVPICVLRSARLSNVEIKKWMLVTMSAPLYRTWFYANADSIPQGALVLELERPNESEQAVPNTDPDLLFQIKNNATVDITVQKNLEWFIQCLINGDLV